MKKNIPAIFILMIFILFPLRVFAESANGNEIIINEIGASEPADTEWMEIHNKGTFAVNLNGWKFFENNTNHGLTPWRGGDEIGSNEYAIIANKPEKFLEKYSSYGGKIFDSSWSSLKEDGEEIGLKDGGGNFVEHFTYPAFEYKPRENKSIQRFDENWTLHPSSNSIGLPNETNEISPAMTQNATKSPLTPTSSSSAILPSATPSTSPSVTQTQTELVQITPTQTASAQTTPTQKAPAPAQTPASSPAKKTRTTSTANSSTDTAGEINELLSQIAGSYDITCQIVQKSGNSTTGTSKKTTKKKTAAATNENPQEEIVSTASKNSADSFNNGDLSDSIKITEVLPNPAEGQDEWIELYNDSDEVVNLGNWRLADASKSKGYLLPDSTALDPREYAIFEKSVTKISLNNSNDAVNLFDFQNNLKNSVSYEKSQKGSSYALIAPDDFQWISDPTPGEQNPSFETVEGVINQIIFNDSGDNSLDVLIGSTSTIINFDDSALDSRLAEVTLPKGAQVTLQVEKIAENYLLKKVENVISPPEIKEEPGFSKSMIAFAAVGAIATAVSVFFLYRRFRRKKP